MKSVNDVQARKSSIKPFAAAVSVAGHAAEVASLRRNRA